MPGSLYFVPHGNINLHASGVGSSSYGPLEWRQAMPGELGGNEEQVIIMQMVEVPYLRMQGQVNPERHRESERLALGAEDRDGDHAR